MRGKCISDGGLGGGGLGDGGLGGGGLGDGGIGDEGHGKGLDRRCRNISWGMKTL